MAYYTSFDASNKADFILDISPIDVDTGEAIDLTGATVSIKVTDGACTVIDATIANGLITQPTTTVLELTIPASTMAPLRPGTFRIGCVYKLNGKTNQLIVGNLVVYDGIASL